MENDKSLSKWTSEDIVRWISEMNVIGAYAENFRLVKDYDELASLSQKELIDFGLSKHEALILEKRITALPISKLQDPPQKTQVKQMAYYSNER